MLIGAILIDGLCGFVPFQFCYENLSMSPCKSTPLAKLNFCISSSLFIASRILLKMKQYSRSNTKSTYI